MKRRGLKQGFVLGLIVAFGLASAWAQQAPEQRGRTRAPRFMGKQTAALLCDALVLEKERAEKVEEAYLQGRNAVREKMRRQFQDRERWRNMDPQERRERFAQIREEIQGEIKKNLSTVLSEEEISLIEPLFAARRAQPDAFVRALRLIDLKPEQRKKLQPFTATFLSKLQELVPRSR